MKNNKIIILVTSFVVVLTGFVVFVYPNVGDPKEPTPKNGNIEKPIYNDYKDVSLDKVFKLNLYDTVLVGKKLEISLSSVDDSRCPANTECYWEGELKYSIFVNDESFDLGTVTNKEVNYKNYKISLDENNNSTEYVLLTVKES